MFNNYIMYVHSTQRTILVGMRPCRMYKNKIMRWYLLLIIKL